MKKCMLGYYVLDKHGLAYVSDEDMSMVLMTRINKFNTKMSQEGVEIVPQDNVAEKVKLLIEKMLRSWSWKKEMVKKRLMKM